VEFLVRKWGSLLSRNERSQKCAEYVKQMRK
jgi:hypothetical protein